MKRIKKIAITLFTISILSLTSCGGDKVLEKGTSIESTKATVEALETNAKDNLGKRFMIEGYMHYKPIGRVFVNRLQTVNVTSEPNGEGERITGIAMKFGENTKNNVFIPESSQETIFYDNEGNALSSKDKVNISFEFTEDQVYPTKIRIDKL